MTRVGRFAAFVSVLTALGSPSLAAAQSPYPQDKDYGISAYLRTQFPACVDILIDGADWRNKELHIQEVGGQNDILRRRDNQALQELITAGMLVPLPPGPGTNRNYKVLNIKAYNGGGGFCFGTETLKRIVKLGPPHMRGAYCMRDAEVVTRVEGIPDWLRSPNLSAYIQTGSFIEPSSERSRTFDLVFYGGWRVSTYEPIHAFTRGPFTKTCPPYVYR
jgi:hypothetical protein